MKSRPFPGIEPDHSDAPSLKCVPACIASAAIDIIFKGHGMDNSVFFETVQQSFAHYRYAVSRRSQSMNKQRG
jgi:hypothetical protein